MDDCLADYTRIELLTDCICRRCSLEATYEKYSREGVAVQPSSPSSPSASPLTADTAHDGPSSPSLSKSKKKRLYESRKLASRVKALIDEGRVEDDVKGVQVVKVTQASTKQAMVARVSCTSSPFTICRYQSRSLSAAASLGPASEPFSPLWGPVWRNKERL